MERITVPPNLDAITEKIIGCAIAVHRALGPGLLESVYRDCLLIELALAGLRVARESSPCRPSAAACGQTRVDRFERPAKEPDPIPVQRDHSGSPEFGEN